METGPVTDDLVAADPIDCLRGPIAPIGGKIALIARGTCDFDVKIDECRGCRRDRGSRVHE